MPATNSRMFSHLGVIPGFACNIKCKHCCTAYMDPGHKLTPGEISILSRTINKYHISELAFVGGEPTLYVKEINAVLGSLKKLSRTRVLLTTNGKFAVTETAALKMLDSFKKLSKVHMSYDKFHGAFIKHRSIKNLYQACLARGIDFDVLFAVQDPTDLHLVQTLRALGNFKIGVQSILPMGLAKKNALGYDYLSFDKRVLSKCCPNKGRLMYVSGKGFATCCSSLMFNGSNIKLCYSTPEGLLASNFYKLASSVPFKRWPGILNIPEPSRTPAQSAECSLCESLMEIYDKKLPPDKKNGNGRDIPYKPA